MFLYPKGYFNSVKDIEIDYLNKNNIKAIIIDVDNTLIDYYKVFPQGTETWVENVKKRGIKFCILSNSNKIQKVKEVAEKLDVPYFYFAKKPLKRGFKKAQKLLNIDSQNIAVIGDQIMTDIFGANRCKMFSILVKPIKEKDIFVTKLNRPLEKFIIKKYLKKANIEGRDEF